MAEQVKRRCKTNGIIESWSKIDFKYFLESECDRYLMCERCHNCAKHCDCQPPPQPRKARVKFDSDSTESFLTTVDALPVRRDSTDVK